MAPPPRAIPVPPQGQPRSPYLPPPPVPPRTGPPPGHGFMPPPYRPKKSNTGAIVTISLVCVLLAVGGFVGFSVLTDGKSRSTSVADSGYEYDNPPTSGDGPITTTTQPTATTTTTTYAPSSASSPTGRTTPTQTRTQTQTTPRGPVPVNKTKDNPLFAGENGTNVVTCNLPKWQSTAAASQAFFTAAAPCLQAAWAPVMQRANLPFSPPKIVFPQGKRFSTGCGAMTEKNNFAAFYCGPDATIYMPFEGLQTQQNGSKIGSYLAVFAHEYGHHIQALSGSLNAVFEEMYEVGPDSAAGLELQRRKELQAQCLGGMWFAGAWNGKGSITDQVSRDMLADGYTRGDDNNPNGPRDHGKRQSYGSWQEQGYRKNRTFQCNTYLAPASSVS
nr:YpfJ protein, zinc metalloprotease superfamily [Kibdelosporangium sp. MJ126-NF4]